MKSLSTILLTLFLLIGLKNLFSQTQSEFRGCGPQVSISAPSSSGEWTFIEQPPGTSFGNSSSPNTYVDGLESDYSPAEIQWYDDIEDEYYFYLVFNDEVGDVSIGFDGPEYFCSASDEGYLDASPSNEQMYDYSWSFISGSGNISPGASPSYVSVDNIAHGNNEIEVTVTRKGTSCSNSATRTLEGYTIQSDAGEDQVVCEPNIQLDGNDPSPGTGTWSVGQGGSANIDYINRPNSSVKLTSGEGFYSFTWYVERATSICPSWDDVNINYNPTTTASASASSDVVCDPSDLTLTGITPGDGESSSWSVVSGSADISSPNSQSTGVTSMSEGDVIFRYTITNGDCESHDDVTVTYIQLEADAGPDQTVCSPDGAQLNANDPVIGSGSWSAESPGAIANPNAHQTTVDGLGQGENYFYWNVSYSQGQAECYASDEVVINNQSVGEPEASANTTVICNADELSLTGTEPGTLGSSLWETISGEALIQQPNNYTTKVTTIAYGDNTFRYTLFNDDCSESGQVTVTMNGFDAQLGEDFTACELPFSIQGNTPPGRATVSWSSNHQDVSFSNSNTATLQVDEMPDGEPVRFTYTITTGNCSNSDDIVVTYYELEANAGPNQNVFTNSAFLSANQPIVGTGFWESLFTDAVIANPNSNETQVTQLEPGPNTFIWNVSYLDCGVEDRVIITYTEVTANAGEDRVVCSPSVTLNASPVPDEATGQWLYNGQATLQEPSNPATSVTNLQPGENTFTWQVSYNNEIKTDDVVITYVQVDANAGDDQVICSSTAQLSAQQPSTGTGTWISPLNVSVEAPGNHQTSVSNLVPGENTFIWRVTEDICSAKDEVKVTNNAVTANAGEDQILCSNSTNLNAVSPEQGTGQWTADATTGSAVTIENGSDPKTAVDNLPAGKTIFTWEVTKGNCTATDEVTIDNQRVTADAGDDQEICSSSAQLSANDPGNNTGTWSTTSNTAIFDDESDPNTSASELSTGEHIFTWSVSNSHCSASDNVKITNNGVEANAGPDISTCTSEAQLNAESPSSGRGTWKSNNDDVQFINESFIKTKVTNLAKGENIFIWEVVNGNCTTSDEVIVTNNSFSVDAGPDQMICEETTRLQAQSLEAGQKGLWEVQSGSAEIEFPGMPKTLASFALGKTVLKWSVQANNCSASDEVSIQRYSVKSSFTYQADGLSVAFTMGEMSDDVVNWLWSFGDGELSLEKNPVYEYAEPGVYPVRLSVATENAECYDIHLERIQVGGFDCRADFEFEVDGSTVNFTNTSEGDITDYYWEFGDGDNSNEENPSHVYQTPRMYRVALVVGNPESQCMDRIVKNVKIGATECNAEFQAFVNQDNNTVVCVNPTSDESFTYNWYFGDSKTSNERFPVHQYESPGIYTIGLGIYSKELECMDFYEQDVVVGESGRDIQAGFIFRVNNTTQQVHFFNKSIGKHLSFKWNFDDGDHGDSKNPQHKYEEPGIYNVCLTAYNQQGSNMICKDVRLTERVQAHFYHSVDPETREVAFVDLSYGNPDTWQWHFGDNNSSDEQNPVHQYSEDGFYPVLLKVSNSSNNTVSHKLKLISINKQGLAIAIGALINDQFFKSGGYPTDFFSSAFGKPGRAIWDFGDGTIDSTSANPTHVYKEPGDYTVCATFVDSITGQSVTECKVVTITAGDTKVFGIEDYKSSLNIIPNPFISNAEIIYSLNYPSNIKLSLVDMLGHEVMSITNDNKQEPGLYSIQLNTHNLNNGMYFLRLKTDKDLIVKKIIKTD